MSSCSISNLFMRISGWIALYPDIYPEYEYAEETFMLFLLSILGELSLKEVPKGLCKNLVVQCVS